MSSTETSSTANHPSGRAGESDEIADRLVEAAVAVFGECGYDTARVADIALRAGLTTGAIFTRWRTKRDLFLAAIDHTTAYRLTFFEKNAEKSAIEMLTALGARLGPTHPSKYENLRLEAFVSGRRDAALGEKVSQFYSAESDELASIVAEGKHVGEIDASLSTAAIVVLSLCIELGTHFAAMAELSDRARPTMDYWNALMSRIVGSIAAPPAGDAATDA